MREDTRKEDIGSTSSSIKEEIYPGRMRSPASRTRPAGVALQPGNLGTFQRGRPITQYPESAGTRLQHMRSSLGRVCRPFTTGTKRRGSTTLGKPKTAR